MIMGVPARVVFWTVFIVAIAPSGWFVWTSVHGLQSIIEEIHKGNSRTTLNYLKEYTTANSETDSLKDVVRAHLELDTISNRQARANSALATRTWLRFMSSGFGSILIFVGAIFLLSKVESTSPISAAGQGAGSGFSFKSTSPGIVMVLIGAGLMISPNFASQKITAMEAPLYTLGAPSPAPASAQVSASESARGKAVLDQIRKRNEE